MKTTSQNRNGILGMVKANPIPMALIGTGLSWLAFSKRRTGAAALRGESGTSTGTGGSKRSPRMRVQARDGIKRIGRRGALAFSQNPLAAGATMLACGTAVGLVVPISKREEGIMGDVVESAREMATTAIDKVGDAAREFAGSQIGEFIAGGHKETSKPS
jgi:hypothetical protein